MIPGFFAQQAAMNASGGGGPGDGIDFANVRLQLHFDGSDGDTVAVDSSSYARTVTRIGSAEIDTAQSAFGVSSGSFPDAGYSGFTLPSSASLDPRADAFQFDWRHRLAANLTDANQLDTVVAMVDGSGWAYEWAVIVHRTFLRLYFGHRGISNSTFRFFYPPGYDLASLGGTQIPFSIARDLDGYWGAWINGALCPSYQISPLSAVESYGPVVTGVYQDTQDFGASGADGSRAVNIGRFGPYGGLGVVKHLDELRFVIGECREVTSDYTPLATAFPDS